VIRYYLLGRDEDVSRLAVVIKVSTNLDFHIIDEKIELLSPSPLHH